MEKRGRCLERRIFCRRCWDDLGDGETVEICSGFNDKLLSLAHVRNLGEHAKHMRTNQRNIRSCPIKSSVTIANETETKSMAQEYMMVKPEEVNRLVQYYEGYISNGALLNEAGRVAAEAHVIANYENQGIIISKATIDRTFERNKRKRRRKCGGCNTRLIGYKENSSDTWNFWYTY